MQITILSIVLHCRALHGREHGRGGLKREFFYRARHLSLPDVAKPIALCSKESVVERKG